ncbi:MAG: hypothetical protein V1720_16165 [bacterium]
MLLVTVEFIIFLFIMTSFSMDYVQYRTIDVTFIVLMLFELTTILKVVNIIVGFTLATAYFFSTSFFQGFMGIFFTLYKMECPKLKIKTR